MLVNITPTWSPTWSIILLLVYDLMVTEVWTWMMARTTGRWTAWIRKNKNNLLIVTASKDLPGEERSIRTNHSSFHNSIPLPPPWYCCGNRWVGLAPLTKLGLEPWILGLCGDAYSTEPNITEQILVNNRNLSPNPKHAVAPQPVRNHKQTFFCILYLHTWSNCLLSLKREWHFNNKPLKSPYLQEAPSSESSALPWCKPPLILVAKITNSVGGPYQQYNNTY